MKVWLLKVRAWCIFFALSLFGAASVAETPESSTPAFELPSDELTIQEFLRSPKVALEELRKVSDSDLMEFISKAPKQKLHPLIFAALKDDTNVLIAYRKHPPLQLDLKDEVPEEAWKRLENLWHDHAMMVFSSLGPLDGCFQVMKNLGGS
jgi:hypothetical protein